MKNLKQYLFLTYSQTFFPIFLILYIVTSIVYLVKIASLTSVIQINFLELLELYLYTVPTIIFYTLPVSIFISLALTFTKLSSEYEMIVITSFGLDPLKVVKLFIPHLTVLTFFLLINALALVPKGATMNQAFIEKKKTEAKFNIKASEYGQQFAQWLIYVEKEKHGIYEDIVLFNNTPDDDTIVIAKTATLDNNGDILSLNLINGKVIKSKDEIDQVDFKKMTINNEIIVYGNLNTFDDLIQYWSNIDQNQKKMYKFTFSILVSLLPITSILFIISIGYFNPRYDKNRTTLYGVILIAVYIIATQKLATKFTILELSYIPVVWMIASAYLYKKLIKSHY
ncbi:MAG: LptF/LptG family permease [Campylobacterota bacterium]|nr:LptF/LptG family permease [Campylobacterota bacterium]